MRRKWFVRVLVVLLITAGCGVWLYVVRAQRAIMVRDLNVPGLWVLDTVSIPVGQVRATVATGYLFLSNGRAYIYRACADAGDAANEASGYHYALEADSVVVYRDTPSGVEVRLPYPQDYSALRVPVAVGDTSMVEAQYRRRLEFSMPR